MQCPKFKQHSAKTSKRYGHTVTILITNRKSHTVFRVVPTSMTLNDLERRNSPYFALFHRIRQLCRLITSQRSQYRLPLLAKTDQQCSAVSLRQLNLLFFKILFSFLPRWIKCRRALAMKILSVRLSNAWIVRKQNKDLSRFLYHRLRRIIQAQPSLLRRRMVGRRRPLTRNFGSTPPVGAKSPILNQYSLVAPQP